MPKRFITLDGDWAVAGTAPLGSDTKSIQGIVPGHVHVDLLHAGEIKDPFWRDQAEDCQWVEDWDWSYSCEFYVDDDFDLDWAVLEFEGLDTFAEIFLNGESIGTTNNMFIPHRFGVGDRLRRGVNRIRVDFAPYKRMIEGKRIDCYPAAFANSERVHVRRMQCTFSWDWVHRFVSAGIWKPVTLFSFDTARIADLFVYISSLGKDFATLEVEFELETRTCSSILGMVEIVDPDGTIVFSKQVAAASGINGFSLDLESPRLWWPNGMGEQPIYECRVRLKNSEGDELDNGKTAFGIRTVSIEQIEDVPGSPEWNKTMDTRRECPGDDRSGEMPGSSFTLIVNGERVFCKGGNWVPADPFPSRITPEHYDRLVKLAKDAGMNLLRCWGGGIYESEAFWDACNRHGVMVSQDFQMACALYPEDDPEFKDRLRKEFPAAVRMLRNNPSLAWWTGDNECGMGDDFDADYWGKRISTAITNPVCAELDPSRTFMPTSSFGGRPNNSLTIGDCHYSAIWRYIDNPDMSDYVRRIGFVGRFMSESAVFGAPPMRSLLKFMTREDVEDPDRKMWEYHTKDNPHKGGDAAVTLYRMLERGAEQFFGTPADMEMRVRQLEYFQYEWIRVSMESARRNKWYCSGIQFWMYNDCWPGSGWSIVDYYGFPKAGYYAMKRGSKPVIASLEDTGDAFKVWVTSDLQSPVSGAVEVRMQPWDREVKPFKSAPFQLDADESGCFLTFPKSELVEGLGSDYVLTCDVRYDGGSDRAFHYGDLQNSMDLIPASLRVEQEGDGHRGVIRISTDNYARVVTLDADLDFSDNYFELLPGETRAVEWASPSDAFEGDIPVTCWNARKD